MIGYLQWFRVINFFKDWPKLPQVIQYIIMRDSLNFKNCDALYEIDCSILYLIFIEYLKLNSHFKCVKFIAFC